MSQFDGGDSSFSSVDPNSTLKSPIRKKENILRSQVWNDFDRRKIIDNVYIAICKTCKKELSAKSSGGTSHLKNHAIRCKKNNQMVSGQDRNRIFSQVESRKDLARMIILHEYPLSMVDHVGFRNFVGGLQPEFRFISRNTIKKDIIKIYDVEKDKTYKLLESIGSRVAITTDMWTAKPTKKGFMAITAHFIDNNWRLQNRILTFVYVPVPHNKDVLSDVILESLDHWNIDRKLSTITVDNASTNDAMLTVILDSLPKSSFLLGGKFLHMRCCAHILNLIVKEGLSVVGDELQRIRDSCWFWTSSQARIEKFEAVAHQLHISCSKGLELDVKTRWNSTYHMLRSALIYKDVFAKLKQREKYYTSLPLTGDWILAEEVCEKLKVFNDITNLFSGTTYPTSNIYFQKVCEIKLGLTKWLDNPSELIQAMARNMLEKYEKYWSVCNIMMAVACVFDPRYKMKLVEFYYLQIYGIETSGIEIAKVQQACSDLFSEYQSRMNLTQNSGFGSSSGTIGFDEHDVLANFDMFVNEYNVDSESELDLYLKERLVPRRVDFDILKWWSTQNNFSILQSMSRDLLAVQVSSVASESVFSASGRLITPHRSRLHPSTLEALMCAQSWLWNDLKGRDPSVDSKHMVRIGDEEEEPIEVMENMEESSDINS